MKEPFAAKASPKTLKQQLQQKLDDDEYGDIFADIDEIVKSVKEWLTQKQPKTTDENTLIRYNCIQELLEELNQ